MFDSLSHAELVAALGRTMRAAAQGTDADTGRDDFVRVQWFSGSSIARYLAEELRHGPALAAWFLDTVRADLADPPPGTDPRTAAACAGAAERLGGQPGPDRLGDVLADLLAGCRARRRELGEDPGPAERRLRSRLRELADRHVTLLTGEDPMAEDPMAEDPAGARR